MARKQTLDAIIQLYKKLGGNTSEVLGTKTNVNFLGKGKSPELMLDMDINPEALGVLPRSQAVEELKNSVGYAVSGKLNDIQANQLLRNMQTMDSVYFPPVGPVNIIDLETRAGPLSKGGLESLRKVMADDLPPKKRFFRGVEIKDPTFDEDLPFDSAAEKLAEIKMSNEAFEQAALQKKLRETVRLSDDLPPPGSRGGPDDIAAPFTGAGLEAIKNVKGSNLIIDDIVDKIYMNAGVTKAAQPAARGNAREFLNRIKDLEDPANPSGPTLSSVMESDDFRFMTEGGGGGMGDPLLLVQKYFGPRVASSVAQLDSADDIQKFAERLVRVRDAKGNTITSRNFDPESVDPNTLQGIDVFDFADGGRVGFQEGGSIEARLEQLGGDVTSAEQMLQNINERLQSAESSLGSGGGIGSLPNNFQPAIPAENTQPQATFMGGPKIPDAVKTEDPYARTLLSGLSQDGQRFDSAQSAFDALAEYTRKAREFNPGTRNMIGTELFQGAEGFKNFTNLFNQINDPNYVAPSLQLASAGPPQGGILQSLSQKTALGFEDGGRVPFFAGMLVRGGRMGYQALRKYGIEGKDISRLYASLGTDKSLVGKEKTEYFRTLNKVLRNPDDFPDEIMEIQKQLGIDVGLGFRDGGLAGILEV